MGMIKKRKNDASPPPISPKVHPLLKKHTGYCLAKAAARFRALFDQALIPYGLIAPQVGLLSLLSEIGPVNQVELGQSLGIDKATMVRLIDGLESRGYLVRVAEKTDRRAKRLEITKAGAAAGKKLAVLRRGIEEEFLGVLTATEREQLRAIVHKLVDAHL